MPILPPEKTELELLGKAVRRSETARLRVACAAKNAQYSALREAAKAVADLSWITDVSEKQYRFRLAAMDRLRAVLEKTDAE